MLIAVANVLISTSNFLFPVQRVDLKNSAFERALEGDASRFEGGRDRLLTLMPPAVRLQARTPGGLLLGIEQCQRLQAGNQSSLFCELLQVGGGQVECRLLLLVYRATQRTGLKEIRTHGVIDIRFVMLFLEYGLQLNLINLSFLN